MWRGIKPHLCRIGASPLIGWKFAPSTSRLKSLRFLPEIIALLGATQAR